MAKQTAQAQTAPEESQKKKKTEAQSEDAAQAVQAEEPKKRKRAKAQEETPQTAQTAQAEEPKDVLLALDQRDNSFGYVTDLNHETGDFNWQKHTPGEDISAHAFPLRTNTMLDQFFDNFKRMYGRPSSIPFCFFRVPVEQAGRVLDRIIKIYQDDNGTRYDRRALDRYLLNDDGRYAKLADRYAFEERELMDSLAKLGVSVQDISDNNDMENLLRGNITNEPVNITRKVGDGWQDLGPACLQAVIGEDGRPEVKFISVLDAPQYLKPAYKKLFTPEQIKNLETDGHLGETIQMKDIGSGRECECYVSLHRPTNRLMTVPADEVAIPSKMYNVEISAENQTLLRSGKSVPSGDINRTDGSIISGVLRVDACRGEVRFFEDRSLPLRIGEKVNGAPVTAEQRTALENHKCVVVAGMRRRDGTTYTAPVRFTETKKLLMGSAATNYRPGRAVSRGQKVARPRPRVRPGNNPLPRPKQTTQKLHA